MNCRGIAIDIGSTNIAAALIAEDGRVRFTSKNLNLQTTVSADIIGRIGGEYGLLRRLLMESVNKTVSELCAAAGIKPEGLPASVAGNTLMSCFFAGLPAESLGHAPFKSPSLFGDEYDIDGFICGKAYIAPCFGAFVGGDISAGLLSAPALRKGGMLYIDAGTNGEVYGCLDGKALVCSAAAGPALENGIGCASRSGGSIADSVRRTEDGTLEPVCRDGTAAAGLSGSGVISLMSLIIGRECSCSGHLTGGSLSLGGGLVLRDPDVCAFQLAKAAIAAAVLCVMRGLAMRPSECRKVCLAGAMGSAVSEKALLRTGLLPDFAAGKTVPLGNSALKGAALLLDGEYRKKALSYTRNAKVLPLDKSEYFKECFAEELFFDE